MKKTTSKIQAVLYVLLLAALALPAAAQESEGLVGPEGFIPPPLHPAGAQLETKQLAPGVYALLSDEAAGG